jgi:hypothetical protein
LLPPGKTKWQIVIEKLNEELEQIPFAYGPESPDPSQATITVANFEVIASPVATILNATPSKQAIGPGGVATYTVRLGGDFSGTVSLTATSPSPDLSLAWSQKEVTPPAQAVLVITDCHPGPILLPGLWVTIPITATGDVVQTTSVALLVGGTRSYLPISQ